MENETLPDQPAGIQLNQEAPQPAGISLPAASAPANLPDPETASAKVNRAVYAIGPIVKKDDTQMYEDFIQGRENDLRLDASSKIDVRREADKQQRVIDYAKANPGGMSFDQIKWATDPFKPTDPSSVIEKSFATRYIQETVPAAARMEAPLLSDAQKEMPLEYQNVSEKATDLATKKMYAQNVIENIQQDISKQGTLSWLVDQAKSVTQIYPEMKLRGNVAGVSSFDGLLGSNLKEQADTLRMQDFDSYKKNFDGVIEKLRKDNPTLALQFAQEVFGVSNEDRRLNNAFTLLAVPDIAAGAKIGKNLIRSIDIYNRTNTAFKHMVEQAGREGPIKATAAEGAGDVAEGAVQRVTQNLATGNVKPIENAISMLPDTLNLTKNMKADATALPVNPGNLSRENVVRLQDGIVADADRVASVIDNVTRVNRTPLPLAAEDAVRAMKESVKNLYGGIKNAIQNISDPIWHPSSNTWHSEVHLGNIGGDLFSSPEVAEGFADMNGIKGARIVESHGTITPASVDADMARKQHLSDLMSQNAQGISERKTQYKDKNLSSVDKSRLGEEIKGLNNFTKKYQKEVEDINGRLAKQVNRDTTEIRQQGLGYKIVMIKPLRETEDAFREYMIKLGPDATKYEKGYVSSALNNITPGVSGDAGTASNWYNALVGKVRGADDTLALSESVQRKVATYSRKAFQEVADSMAKKVEQIATGNIRKDVVTGEPLPWWKRSPITFYNKVTLKNKEMFEQFNSTLNFAKEAKNPDTGALGYYFQTPGELTDHYMRYFRRAPTFAEHEAYFAHVQLLEFDRILGEMAEFRNRSRLGTEQHAIRTVGADGKPIVSDYFDGIHKKDLPRTDDTVLVMGSRKGDERLMTLNKMAGPEFERYKEAVRSGEYKLVDIYDADQYPLSKFSDITGGEFIRYVLSKNVDTKPMEYNHVARRGGGHYEYDYNQYIKQARIVPTTKFNDARDNRAFVHMYTGDTTIMPIANRGLGEKIIGHLNNVRELIRDGDEAAAKQYIRDNKFGIEYKQIKTWFSEGIDADGLRSRPFLDVNEPIRLVNKNQKIFDIDKELENRYKSTFKDGTKTGSLGAQFRVQYNTERGEEIAKTVNDYGTQGNPLYKYEKADLVDPIPTMNRALDRMINSTFMDDYKTMSVEHWLREATPYLKEDESLIKSSPMWLFHTVTSKDAFKVGTPQTILNNLLSNKYKIEQFLGVPDKFDTWVHGATQALVDAAYNRYGSETGRTGLQKAITVPPIWALSKIKDPVSLLRGFAFNAKLGLFAVPQLLTQMQTYASIWAIAPREGLAGTYATMLHSWARINRSPEFINMLDNYASKLNFAGSKFKPGEFKEAFEQLHNTGFETVAGEYAIQDNMKHKYIGDTWGNFLKAGQIPFHEGERAVRLGAWYTAFREFRDANPSVVIGNTERANIVARADLLSNNMSRASNSMLHGGVLSLPTQFLSYQIRLGELFWGKRLGETLSERNMARARMIAVYSALYGAPGALGLTGLPLGDDMRQEFINRGYVPGESFIKSVLTEGLPAVTMAAMTGGGDIKKGNFYNVGQRLNPQGFTQIQDALKSDAPFLQIAGGASVSTFSNTLTASDGFLRAMTSMIRGDKGDMAYQITPDTFADMFKEISSFNSAWRLRAALNTGKWLNKWDSVVTEVSPANAIFMSLTGLTPTEQADMFTKGTIVKEEVAQQKWALKMFITDFQRGAMMAGTNPDQSKVHYANAFARLYQAGYPSEKIAAAIGIAAKGYETRIKSSDYDFAFKNVPQAGRSMFGMFETEGKQSVRRQQYKTQQDINDARNAQ